MTTDTLGDRMKAYEAPWSPTLPPNLPVIIRVDGRAFSKFTRGLHKPFDEGFISLMAETAQHLCENLANAKLAYTQSDEISILLRVTGPDAQPMFDNSVVKLSTISASTATAFFNANLRRFLPDEYTKRMPLFDGRAFVLPEADVSPYFAWRAADWHRNSLSMYARTFYSQKELAGKNRAAINELLHEKGANWAKLPERIKNGTVIVKRERTIPIPEKHGGGSVKRSKWSIEEAPKDTRKLVSDCLTA